MVLSRFSGRSSLFSLSGVFGRRFQSNGDAIAADFQINLFTPLDQERPALATAPTGELVVAWESDFQDTDYDGIFGQFFSAAGVGQQNGILFFDLKEYFAINDCGESAQGGCATDPVFLLEADAPAHAMYIDSDVHLGLGTIPIDDMEIHIATGNEPRLRLEQNGSNGFTAQAFYKAFGLGADEHHIAPLDAAQALELEVRSLRRQNAELERRLAELEKRLP